MDRTRSEDETTAAAHSSVCARRRCGGSLEEYRHGLPDTSGALAYGILMDRKFDRILEYLVKKDVAVVFHAASREIGRLPVDKMMSNDMKEFSREHPEYL